MNQFPLSHWVYHEGRRIFPKIRWDTVFAAQGAPPVSLTPVANGKNLQSEKFYLFFRTHLGSELTYRYIFFFFKFTLSCQHADIVPIICHWCRHLWQICRRCNWYCLLFATGVVDTGNKFSAGIVDTGGKFANVITGRWQNLPPVSLIPVANLPPVSLIPDVHLDLRISPQHFEKIRNDPIVIFWGLGPLGEYD